MVATMATIPAKKMPEIEQRCFKKGDIIMRKTKRFAALLLVLVLTLSMGMSVFAESKKQTLLDEMVAAATELGVQDSVRFKNAYNSLANYEGTISDEQYEAALKEIQYIKETIAEETVDVARKYRDNDKFVQDLVAHLIAAAEAVGVTVVYDGDGAGHVTYNVSDPIKQTGLSYTSTIVMLIAIAAVFGGCFATARRKQLFA